MSNLGYLYCADNNLTSIDLQQLPKLRRFECQNNQFTSLDVSEMPELWVLRCSNNPLKSLDLTASTKFEVLQIYGCGLKGNAMGNLINSLVTYNTTVGKIELVNDCVESGTPSIMTSSQVQAARAKGWNPQRYTTSYEWVDYEGVETVMGDANGDGNVTSADVTVIYNYILNNDESGLVNGDVNGDGYITSADVTFVYNILLGNVQIHQYVDLGLPSGTLWAITNVGADKPEDYGDYFAWGETTPKDVYDWSNYKWCNGSFSTLTKYCTSSNYGYNGYTDSKYALDAEDDAATANWGSEWRMPTMDQMEELINNCTTVWTTINGVNGRLFTSNINGATLFLSAAGGRLSEPGNVGSYGYYWSRSLHFASPFCADILQFSSSNDMAVDGSYRLIGYTVRAVRVTQ